MHIRVLPEADAELAEARVWYRHQRDGLDVELIQRSTRLYRGLAMLRVDFHMFIGGSDGQSSDSFHLRSSTN